MVSPAQKKASQKWEAEKTDRILLRLPKGKKIMLENLAGKKSESVNALINRLIDEELSREA